jgi:hypothetical protein
MARYRVYLQVEGKSQMIFEVDNKNFPLPNIGHRFNHPDYPDLVVVSVIHKIGEIYTPEYYSHPIMVLTKVAD